MTRARRWKIAAIASGVLVAVLVAGAIATNSWCRATERTYHGPHSDLLHVGERVTFSEDFRPAEGRSIAKAQSATVREEPAWDEDSCDPNRPIEVTLASGELVSVPRHILHR
jgi:hypothetical protein